MKQLNQLEIALNQPTGMVILMSTITITVLSTIQWSLVFLFISFILDFISGIYASWVEWKNLQKPKLKTYLIESSKLRKSLTKAVGYMFFIAFVYGFECLFFIKSFKLSVSELELTITLVAIGVCVAIEFFSILENFKRSGYDILGKIRETANSFWNVFKSVKGENNE